MIAAVSPRPFAALALVALTAACNSRAPVCAAGTVESCADEAGAWTGTWAGEGRAGAFAVSVDPASCAVSGDVGMEGASLPVQGGVCAAGVATLRIDDTLATGSAEITFAGEDYRTVLAENSADAMAKLRSENPAVALVDASLGGESALRTTARALEAEGLPPVHLAEWPDIDTVADLRHLADSLAGPAPAAPRTRAWLAAHGDLVPASAPGNGEARPGVPPRTPKSRPRKPAEPKARILRSSRSID